MTHVKVRCRNENFAILGTPKGSVLVRLRLLQSATREGNKIIFRYHRRVRSVRVNFMTVEHAIEVMACIFGKEAY